MQSFAETWIEEGREEGLREGAAAITLRLIHNRFGALDAETNDRIRALTLEKLEQLSEALFNFTSRDDLIAWLLEHSADEN